MLQAFNTFIDDIFAFIITMPTAHRLACFRDDIVFVVYLYQRWYINIKYIYLVLQPGAVLKKNITIK